VLSAAFVLVILGRPDFVAAQQARHPQATAKNDDQAARIARPIHCRRCGGLRILSHAPWSGRQSRPL